MGLPTRTPDRPSLRVPEVSSLSLAGTLRDEVRSVPDSQGVRDGDQRDGTSTGTVADPHHSAGPDPASSADPFAVAGPPTSLKAETRARLALERQAYTDILSGIRDLATARGHILEPPITDGPQTVTQRCERCHRWVTVALYAKADDVGITGQALAVCRGTPHQRVQADPSRADWVGFLPGSED